MPFKDNATQRSYKREWYKNNSAKVKKEVANRKKNLLAWVREIKSSRGCSICAESHPACLDFHHRNSEEKEYVISKMIVDGAGRERILKEIDKCDVVCSNCHRKLHYEEHNGELA